MARCADTCDCRESGRQSGQADIGLVRHPSAASRPSLRKAWIADAETCGALVSFQFRFFLDADAS